MMTQIDLIAVAGWAIAALFGLLCAVLGWLGNKIFIKLETMSADINGIASELHEKVNGIDKRLTVVETRCMDTHDT